MRAVLVCKSVSRYTLAFTAEARLLFFLSSLAALAGEWSLPATVHTLDNGLTVLLLEDHRTDTVALHLRYSVGAKDEHADEQGCAHLFEHLMFEGSKNVPGNAFDTWLTAAGGDNNAWTSEDETAYHMTFPSGALDVALFLESDRMGFLKEGLTPENLANQQSVVVQERYRYYDAPNGQDWDAMTYLLFPPEHPYGHTVLGPVSTVQAFTPEGVARFWERNYKPGNAVLALVGNFQTDEALAKVKHWFSDIPDRGKGSPILTTEAPAYTAGNGLLTDEVEERSLYLAWTTVPLGHPDEPALDLLSNVLSNGRGTRLDDALYFDRTLASETGAWANAGVLSGWFMVKVASPTRPLAKLVTDVEGVIGALETEPVTAEELDRAKRALRGGILDHIEEPSGRASSLVACYVTTGTPDCLAADWARYAAVTSEDLARVARTWLSPERRVSLSVVPQADAGALSGARPVEMP